MCEVLQGSGDELTMDMHVDTNPLTQLRVVGEDDTWPDGFFAWHNRSYLSQNPDI